MFSKLAKEIEKLIRFVNGRENDSVLRKEVTEKVEAHLKANTNKHKYVSYRVDCNEDNNPPDFIKHNGFKLEVYVQRKNLKYSVLSLTVEEDYRSFSQAWLDWKARNKILN